MPVADRPGAHRLPRPGARRGPAVSVAAVDSPRPAPSVVVLPLVPADPADADAPRPGVVHPAPGPLRDLVDGVGVDLDRRLRRAGTSGAPGTVCVVELERDRPETLLLLGVGDSGADALRRAGAALGRKLPARGEVVVVLPPAIRPAAARALAEGLLLASYRYSWRRNAPPASRAVVVLLAPARRVDRLAAAVSQGSTTAGAVTLARDLANTPANLKSPAWLVRQAVAAGRDGLLVTVRDEAALRADGFGGLVAVGGGSARPPALVRIDHRPPGSEGVRPVVLVGKGITFDSGGLSIKPADAMKAMKTDMSGAAAVLAAMTALPGLEVTIPVTALLAVAENLPSGSSYRPGDVITHRGGRTSEVLNTDAEGRLVLADAIAYAAEVLDPAVIVDVATLTGAATAALGRGRGALLSPDDRLARSLLAAAESSGERLWRLPLVEDYASALHSDVADASHVPRDRHVGGGAITAALFLRPFAGMVPWAHLDIAGPARSDTDRDEVTRGGTGFGTRLLCRWLESR